MITEILAGLGIVKDLVNRFVPDPDKARELALKIEELHAQLLANQSRINEKEAEHSSIFVAGWRPFIGWVCGIGCTYSFILQPFLSWIAVAFGFKPFISLDTSALMALLTGMLGLTAARSYEKVQEVARENGIKFPWSKK